MARPMEQEFSNKKMVLTTKANGKMTTSTVKARRHSLTDLNMSVILLRDEKKVTVD